MTQRKPKTPDGLAQAGQELWLSVVEEWDLDVHEKHLLLQACRTTDRLDAMDKELATAPMTVENKRGDTVPHPLLTESRQQSLTLSRLLASIRLPSGDEADLHRPQRRGASRGSYGIRGVV
jgi:hypothetical protein